MILSKARLASVAIPAFFGLKLGLGMAILVAAARFLSVVDFAVFSQLLVLLALLVTLATGGVQHGIIRQVAAEQSSAAGVHAVIRAGLAIWAAVGIFLIFAATVLDERIAVLLVGSTDVAYAIPLLAVLAAGAGLGALLCAILTGQGRPVASLASQAVGLVASTALALFFLSRQQPVAAASGFAAGPLLTALCAMTFVSRPLIGSFRSSANLATSVRQLLGFSTAFLATASVMPLTLIGLRSVYQEAFSLELLGYWLAANRISDVNTQLLGLYLTQEYLPKASSVASELARRALLIRTLLVTISAMLVALVVFSAAPTFWVTIFLSAKFVPAIGFIQGYLVGDLLRVASSLVAYTALAKKRLVLYVSIEALAAASMAAIVLACTLFDLPTGPPIGYAGTYGIIALASALYCWRAGLFGGRREGAKDDADHQTALSCFVKPVVTDIARKE